ncbi:VgrG protein [Klebsiella pneumoniae subsp. pneumoniae ST258-K28BO]|nr:VgrG protein [Klebsiella pneumoniae subsp. pneumoniae ST258-K28BO]
MEQQVSTRDYNYREATADMNAQVDVTRGETTTFGEAYHWGDNYLTAGNVHDRHPAPESGAFYARLRHERYLNGQTRMQATTSCPTLCPGQVLKVTGGEEVAREFADGVLITAMHSHARRDADFAVEFAGIPDSPDVGYRPEPGARPVMAGTLPARVTSTRENDTYGHIDKHGRYRVNMLFDRARWETGFESLWVRQSRPYAGDTYGLHLPLLAGTEVAIGFEDGNPDRPYIAGVLHDSAHGDHVTIRNDKRNVLRTPANNKIRLDDERGKEHIKVSTEYGGKSQLNLGHLVDSDRQPRGEGFELRTDSWGAIRAQKGIFISADGQVQAQGQVLAMEPAVSLLKGAVNQVTEWGSITQTHHNVIPDTGPLSALTTGASDLKQPTLLMSAPQGIAAVTPETTLLHSGKGLYLQSLGEVNITTAQRCSLNASQAISLLAQQEGMRLVSAKGPLQVESHGDILSLTALKDITVQSTQGHLQLTAKNGITLGCGGAYIRLTPQGEIQIHGPGVISLKGQHDLQGPVSEEFPLPELPASVCKECLEPGARPVMAGTLPARVTSTRENDTYGHIDKHGRYRVNMLFDRARWETGFESLWVRQSRPYAGDTYGLHLPLLAGTEVAIGFEDGNPDRPYIAGVLHDSAHGDHVTIRNDKRNVLRTPANNKIRLDDERGKEHIKVSTEYGGKSQLNLGHLVDSDRQPRGEGFELRTDSWGAIRAQKGIFISADGQVQAQGQVLAMEPAVSLLKGAVNQVTEWGSITQTHHNVIPDTGPLSALTTGASDLKQPTLLMSAPQGIAAVTPETTLLHSGKGLYLQSLGEVNITTAQRCSLNASQAISLLAQQEGMRLVSAKGPLQVESHGDILSLTALKDITVQSTQGHLQLTAKNGITLGCGGAYIRLTPQGEIQIHGPGVISLKGQHDLQGPVSEEFPLPELPASVCKECLKKAQALAQGFVPREA